MKWVMEIEEVEAILEKIWDIHDKLSEAIHSITRAHFLNSIKTARKSKKKDSKLCIDAADGNRELGCVFVKEFRIDATDSAIQEAKSLNGIRTSLENLEDQLEFFHTVQMQQRPERDAAIARLEQGRIVLAMRLADHHGKNHKVIEEALAFVGDINDAALFVSPEHLYGPSSSPNGRKFVSCNEERSNVLLRLLFSSIDFAKNSLKLDHIGGILGNAALLAVSMIALVHMQRIAYKELPEQREDETYLNRNARRTSWLEGGSSSNVRFSNLDVLSARG